MIPIDPTYTAIYYDRHYDGSAIEAPPVGMLLHHGGGSQASDLYILTGKDPARKVGTHYYVTRSGTIYQLCPDTYAAWHAGAPDHLTTRWWGNTAASYGVVNGNRLLGVETEHRPGADWPAEQMTALAALFHDRIARYRFPLTRLGGHKWFAPSRKTDPADFPDADLQSWLRGLYRSEGSVFEVTAEQGARIRQGPGTQFPIAETLPVGYTFWSDQATVGQAIDGNNVWVHFFGPTPTIVNPLGFIWSGIVREVAS
jgi:hypothetical protein